MRRFAKYGALGAGLVATILATAGLAQTTEMVVTANNAPLMRGNSTLATLPAGQRVPVLRREGRWVGTRTLINGKTVGGWLWQGQVATPQQFAQRTAPRRYSYQPSPAVRRYSYVPAVPGAATPSRGPYPYALPYLWPESRDYVTGGVRSGSPLIMGATKYGPQYWRADRKIIGY
jgi:hypothetical protein